MAKKQDDTTGKPAPKPRQTNPGDDAKQPVVTRHSQTGQQQAQHGGAAQGPGKGGSAKGK